MRSVFQRIIEGELPAEKIFENESLVVIKDTAPVSTHHFLIIPKVHYLTLDDVPEENLDIVQKMVKTAQVLAKKFSLENNYRLLINVGKDGGQSVFHLHMHFIGGYVSDQKLSITN